MFFVLFSPAPPVPKIKESETLNATSMVNMARGLGREPEALTLPMLLNLPTTTIINLIYEASEVGKCIDFFFYIKN
jgi:hypothetical protein